MDSDLTPEQRAQLDNRDAKGKFRSKAHSEVDDEADVLGLGARAPADQKKATFCMALADVHSQAPGSASAALESDSALVRLAARSGWDIDDRRAAQRSAPEARIEAAVTV